MNTGGERGTKKRTADTGKWPACFSVVKTARKIPSVTSSTASFSGVYFIFYLYLCTARSALDYDVALSINTALDMRQVCFWRSNLDRNGNRDLTTRRTIQMFLDLVQWFKKSFKIAIVSIKMSKLGLLKNTTVWVQSFEKYRSRSIIV